MKKPPTVYSFCFGVGEDLSELGAFDAAILDAGVGNFNLVEISSILPPGCREQDVPRLEYGQPLLCAYASKVSSVPGSTMSVAVGIAVPGDKNLPGVIMEHCADRPAAESEKTVHNMCSRAMHRRGITNNSIVVHSRECLVAARTTYTCIFGGVILYEH